MSKYKCPVSGFDCISCENGCLLEARRKQGDPFRRGNELQTCDDEQKRLGLDKRKSQRAIFGG